MSDFRALSSSEQLAEQLKGELLQGCWVEVMPGERRLMKLFGVGQGTVRAALAQLEAEGILSGCGQGRRRTIQLDRKALPAKVGLKIGLLCYDALSSHDQDLLEVRCKLQEMGFIVIDAPKTIQALGGDVRKIAKVVSKMEVDAWIVRSGPKDLLQWMAACGLPTFAVFGIQKGIKVAGALPDHRRAVGQVVDRLVAMGHTRVVLMVARSIHGSAGAGRTEQVFLDGLKKASITVGEYNLPRWKENPDDYRRCLESLFQFTPPTAMIIEEPKFLFAAIQFCGERAIRIPQDVSMVCLQHSEMMAMGKPSIAHMKWESQSLVRRVLAWAEHVAKGIADDDQIDIPVKFIDGESSGLQIIGDKRKSGPK